MADFNASQLGTKEHWDAAYSRELQTYHDIGEEGEIWFGEDAVESMVDWISNHVEPDPEPTILDVGCGNGHLLFALHEAGYSSSSMTGADYSSNSISLCRDIEKKRGVTGIRWEVCDCLVPNPQLGQFALVLDKGTYDAISLAPAAEQASHPRLQYAAAIAAFLRHDGLFVITSCNWTEEELREQLGGGQSSCDESDLADAVPALEYYAHVRRPKFTFGGQQGSTISTVIFQRKR